MSKKKIVHIEEDRKDYKRVGVAIKAVKQKLEGVWREKVRLGVDRRR